MPIHDSAPKGKRPGFLRPETSAAFRQLPPEELIAQCIMDRAGSWEEFLRRYGNLIYSSILKVGLPVDDQEEAFQSTIVAIHAQLPKLRHPEKVVPWIVGIAWRQAINRIRARRRHKLVEGALNSAAPDPLDASSPDRGPVETRLLLEQAQRGQEAMEHASERCRRLLHYLFYEDPSPGYAEIARREGVPVGSLGPTRARCLERMKRYFEERGWEG